MIGHITQKGLDHSYHDLTERAKIDLDFLLLTVAAAAICALGFKMNSAPVIVGAMVISPLLYPVICAGAATYQADWSAFIRAVGTFAVGFIAVCRCCRGRRWPFFRDDIPVGDRRSVRRFGY